VICSLLLNELTILALGDDLHHVIFSCGLVESMSKYLANDRTS
jgi:hypothetical protein